jgi:hypothetical protein
MLADEESLDTLRSLLGATEVEPIALPSISIEGFSHRYTGATLSFDKPPCHLLQIMSKGLPFMSRTMWLNPVNFGPMDFPDPKNITFSDPHFKNNYHDLWKAWSKHWHKKDGLNPNVQREWVKA